MYYRTKVVVIDSGISMRNSWIDSQQVKGISLVFGNRISISNDIEDKFGHGTSVYDIIKKHDPVADIFVLKIFDDNNKLPTIDHLLIALKYVNENIEFDLVNISLTATESSSSNQLLELRDLCDEICRKKKIIIAAFSNDGLISYPAAFNSVIGVSSGEFCHKTTDLEFFESGCINVCALGSQQKVLTTEGYVVASGNSLACAHVTGMISKSFMHEDDLKSVLGKLKNIARYTYNNTVNDFNKAHPLPSVYGKVAVFPLNKETQCLFRFIELLLFPISKVYDTKYSGYVGSNIGEVISRQEINYKINDIAEIDYNAFDTLILGHVEELCYSKKIERTITEVINNCLEKDKYIYSFGNVDRFVKTENSCLIVTHIFTPDIKKENIYYAPMGKLFRISRPVIGIFGTGSKQGKFTLQLTIRKKITEWGYKVGQISSEPSGYLFGMDICYPFGYGSSTEIFRHDMIAYLNMKEWELCQKGVDLIIAGCQSFVIPDDYNNLDRFPLSQLEFLYGIFPDAVILCVNAYDKCRNIMRSIQLIESAIDCRVLGLVVSPIDITYENNQYWHCNLSDDRFRITEKALRKVTDLPVFRLDNKNDMEQLCLDIIDYFKAEEC